MDLAQHLLGKAESTPAHSDSQARELAAAELSSLLDVPQDLAADALRDEKGTRSTQRRYAAEIGGLRWLVSVRTPLGSDAAEVERFYLGGRYCDWLGRESKPMLTKRANRYCSNTHHLARRFAQEDEQAAASANWSSFLIAALACVCVIVIAATTGPLFGAIALLLFACLVPALLNKTSGRKPRALPEWGPPEPAADAADETASQPE